MKTINNKKYPKSKSGIQCITPCYPSNLWTLNPITFRYHTANEPYCHISNDPEQLNREIDSCNNAISIEQYNESMLELLYPSFEFDCKYFLNVYNNIKNLEDGLNYLHEKKYVSIYTRARVVECLLKEFGKNIEIIDDRLVDFFIELVKKKWLPELYARVHTYIGILNDSVIISDSNELEFDEYKIERINYLIENFINKEVVTNYLFTYIENNIKNWDEIQNQLENIKIDFLIFLHDKINNYLHK